MPANSRGRQDLDIGLPDGTSERLLADFSALWPTLIEDNGFKAEYLKSEMLSKYLDPKVVSPSDRRDAAIAKWRNQELVNASTNCRLQLADDDTDFGWCTWPILRKKVRRLVARVLGPVIYPDVISRGIHTNGASVRVRRSPAAAISKLSGEALLSASGVKHWCAAWSCTALSCQTISLCESSVLFTVPKKSDIDRVACKEPEGNMLLQRSVGLYIRERLRRFGIDLQDQSRNQELARNAIRRGLATIDLSSASDSISRQAVFELLPFDWWSLLDDLRVKSTIIDGVEHQLEMFSSMGNGFTFELESLLFFAITKVVCWASRYRGREIRGSVSVYGDDIIAPSAVVRRLRRVFSFFGFVMNPKKTHYGSRNPFRESCGKHYYRGFDVTPFYVRKEVQTLPELITFLNHVLEWSGRGWGCFMDESLWHFWLRWRELVPKRLWGGLDPADSTALVTGDKPQMRLVKRTRAVGFDQFAGLLYWLMAAQGEREEALFCDPRLDVSWRCKPLHACGERTSWVPGLAFEPSGS